MTNIETYQRLKEFILENVGSITSEAFHLGTLILSVLIEAEEDQLILNFNDEEEGVLSLETSLVKKTSRDFGISNDQILDVLEELDGSGLFEIEQDQEFKNQRYLIYLN